MTGISKPRGLGYENRSIWKQQLLVNFRVSEQKVVQKALIISPKSLRTQRVKKTSMRRPAPPPKPKKNIANDISQTLRFDLMEPLTPQKTFLTCAVDATGCFWYCCHRRRNSCPTHQPYANVDGGREKELQLSKPSPFN